MLQPFTRLGDAIPCAARPKSAGPSGRWLPHPTQKGDCNALDGLEWNGKGFLGDYVYLDNIVEVRKIGENAFAVKSVTKTDDDNTAKSGKIWRGIVRIENSAAFELKQHADREDEKLKIILSTICAANNAVAPHSWSRVNRKVVASSEAS